MSKKANPTVIGVFVLVAIAIAAGALFILSSGKLFKERTKFILFFDPDSNLSGLDVGAPVDFNGVRIGSVLSVSLVLDHADGAITIPVVIELARDSFTEINVEKKAAQNIQVLIDRGMRAQLQSQNLVTGKLKVQLGYHPKSPKILRAKNHELVEIPTIPGTLESLTNRIENLPLEEIVLEVRATTQALAEISTSGKLEAIARNLEETTQGLTRLVKRIDKLPLEQIAGDASETTQAFADIAQSGTLKASMDNLRETVRGLSEMANSAELNNTIDSLNSTLQESRQFLENINQRGVPVLNELMLMLSTFRDAAKSFQYLTDYLERHPETLLRGKGRE